MKFSWPDKLTVNFYKGLLLLVFSISITLRLSQAIFLWDISLQKEAFLV